ncbi:MAG: YneF family protein [Erysipelotrichia bacterium]|nr:YneF family protein [Erysipelotrichia bacterium]
MMEIQIWQFIIWVVVALVGGGVAGFFITRYLFQKQMRDNPPINEKMIRAMFKSMGRTASEKQIREVMRSMRDSR